MGDVDFREQVEKILESGKTTDWGFDGDNPVEVDIFDSGIALDYLIDFLKDKKNFKRFKQLIDEE